MLSLSIGARVATILYIVLIDLWLVRPALGRFRRSRSTRSDGSGARWGPRLSLVRAPLRPQSAQAVLQYELFTTQLRRSDDLSFLLGPV
jgi:hypothetical protein